MLFAFLLAPSGTFQTCNDVQSFYTSSDITSAGSCCTNKKGALVTPMDLHSSDRVTAVVHLRFKTPLSEADPVYVANVTKYFEVSPAAVAAIGGPNAPEASYAVYDKGVIEFYKYKKPEHHHEFINGPFLAQVPPYNLSPSDPNWVATYGTKAKSLAGLPDDFAGEYDLESVTVMTPNIARAKQWYDVDSKGSIPAYSWFPGTVNMTLTQVFETALFGPKYRGIHLGQ